MPSVNVQGSGWGCKSLPPAQLPEAMPSTSAPPPWGGSQASVQSPGTAARALAQGAHSLRGSR